MCKGKGKGKEKERDRNGPEKKESFDKRRRREDKAEEKEKRDERKKKRDEEKERELGSKRAVRFKRKRDDEEPEDEEPEDDEPGAESSSKKANTGPAFKITCLYIGQGDCILIRCPDIKETAIMIDCGSLGGLTGYEEKLKEQIIALGVTKIDHLIITHSDQDHHNKISLLADEEKGGKICVKETILGDLDWSDKYFVENPGEKSADKDCQKANEEYLKKYTGREKKIWEKLKLKYKIPNNQGKSTLEVLNSELGCNTFLGLTINKTRSDKRVFTIGKDDKGETKATITDETTIKEGENLSNGYHLVCESKTQDWSIKIIAAQVETTPPEKGYLEKSRKVNAASLVTLIQFGGKQAVFTGDATGDTLKYLLTKKLINPGVALLQIPHHGSETNESGLDDFVSATLPNNLFASVRFGEEKSCLPKWSTLQKWKTVLDKNDDENKRHYIGYWIERTALMYKRIFSTADYGEKKIPGEQHPRDFVKEVDVFLDNVLPAGKLKDQTLFYGLKEDKTDADKRDNLFAFIIHKFNDRELVFVIQRTYKSLHVNGSTAVNKHLATLVKDKAVVFNPNATRSGLLYSTVESLLEKTIMEAFNCVGSTHYTLNSQGLTFIKESSLEKSASSDDKSESSFVKIVK